MSDGKVKRWWSRAWIWWLTLLVFYALSIGPAYLLAFKDGYPPPGASSNFLRFYTPIIWLCRKSEAVDRVVDRYLRLFGG
jgi:hypothetical protein